MSIPTGNGSNGDTVATFHISLLFRHPTIDPEAITEALGVKPTSQARVGDRVRPAVDGTLRHGVERDSAWALEVACRDRDPDGDCPDIEAWLKAFLEPFVSHREFVRQLAAESTVANVDLEFPGQFHFGGALGPSVLLTISDLGLTLGIEVFPNSAT